MDLKKIRFRKNSPALGLLLCLAACFPAPSLTAPTLRDQPSTPAQTIILSATESASPTQRVMITTSSPDLQSTSIAFQLTLLPTPYESPTPTVSVTPFPTVARSETKPDCSPGALYTRCYDAILKLSFEYPARWGAITGNLRNTLGQPVFAYTFSFTNPEKLAIQAGGRGKGIIEARGGGSLTDFRGFKQAFPGACGDGVVFFCQEISPQVIFEISGSQAEDVCQPAPGVEQYPMVIVMIDLPDNPTINGFLFASEFLSDAQKQELDGMLGYSSNTMPRFTTCDAESQQRYDARVNAIVADVINGSGDAVTRDHFEMLLHLAHSISMP